MTLEVPSLLNKKAVPYFSAYYLSPTISIKFFIFYCILVSLLNLTVLKDMQKEFIF